MRIEHSEIPSKKKTNVKRLAGQNLTIKRHQYNNLFTTCLNSMNHEAAYRNANNDDNNTNNNHHNNNNHKAAIKRRFQMSC